MAGHSHWASIKHKKSAVDAKKGKIFSKIARMITVAARNGGGNPDMNPKLELAIEKARLVNMPKDNIERAIQKGTRSGTTDADLFECLYEGYGPCGVAIMVDIVTDNKNRTAPEIRKLFERYGGNMGESGCVSWLFEKKGIIFIDSNGLDEDELMTVAIDAGAEDMQKLDNTFQITCSQTELSSIRKALEERNIKIERAEVSWQAKTTIDLDEESSRKILNLIEALEEHDDVQGVYSNFNIPESLLTEM